MNASTGRVSAVDVFLHVVIPVALAAGMFAFWPLDANTMQRASSNMVTGASIVSSLMCGVAVMLFQLRTQIASERGFASRGERRLIDETYYDVLWSVVVGFSAVALIVVGDFVSHLSPCAWKALVAAAIALVANMAMATCMGIKRIAAAYEIISKVWDRAGNGDNPRS
ncbi:hypothetical protein [Berryella intestinalis]|uniref:hypothetical protein n=1 Tax=Berryella intestinalis TaxID=1531429 RepID=UPI00130D51B0|nr:hypothetical protein [Berryella intestinalis]